MVSENIKNDLLCWFRECVKYDNHSKVLTCELYASYEAFITPKIPLKHKTFVTNFKKTFERDINLREIQFSYEQKRSIVKGVQLKIINK